MGLGRENRQIGRQRDRQRNREMDKQKLKQAIREGQCRGRGSDQTVILTDKQTDVNSRDSARSRKEHWDSERHNKSGFNHGKNREIMPCSEVFL